MQKFSRLCSCGQLERDSRSEDIKEIMHGAGEEIDTAVKPVGCNLLLHTPPDLFNRILSVTGVARKETQLYLRMLDHH